MRSWKAVRKGSRYCSSACGHGCSVAEFHRATRNAKNLVTRLRKSLGGTWKARVWENLGWHYAVTNNELQLEVHDFGGGRIFGAFLQVAGPWGGNLVERGSTPETAIRQTLRTAKRKLEPMVALYERLAQ